MKSLTRLTPAAAIAIWASILIPSAPCSAEKTSDDYLLLPLHVGRIWTYHCSNSRGDHWLETRHVLDTVEHDGKTYYTFHMVDNNPYNPREAETAVRATNYGLFEWADDTETLVIVAGPPGLGILNDNRLRTIVAHETLTLPYGGPFTAYTYEILPTDEQNPVMEASFVMGLGFVRFIEHTGDHAPIEKVLSSITPDQLCGDYGCPYPLGDLNHDCIVDFFDLLILTSNWLESNDCHASARRKNEIDAHVSHISMTQGIDYDHPGLGDDENEFILELYADDTVTSVDVILPDLTAWTIHDIERYCRGPICTEHYFDDGHNVWRLEQISPFSLKNYDGLFVITVHYDDGGYDATTVSFTIPGTINPIPDITQRPIVTYPPHDVDVLSPVTITWLPCSDSAADEIHIMLQNEGAMFDTEEIFPKAATSWPNLNLSVDPYEIELTFRRLYEDATNIHGIPLTLEKYTQSDYKFGVRPPG